MNDMIFRSDALKALSHGEGCSNICSSAIKRVPAVDAAPIVRCRVCKHKKLDGPSTCKSIVNEFYCDEKLGWLYQYEGEPDILDWFCADGEQRDGGETDGNP